MPAPQIAWAAETLTFATRQGPLEVTPLGHASLLFKFNSQVIHVDPFSSQADYASLPKADQIWITHDHGDHLDAKAISQIRKDGTHILADPRSAEKLDDGVTVLRNGDRRTVGGVEIEAVPAYNLVQERAPGQKYHPKGWYNGYVADFGGFRVYIAGDTEAIPEMGDLGPIDLAFIPINLPFTMPLEEAVGAIKVISPKRVIPYHQGQSNPAEVARLLTGSGIEVIVLALP